MLNFFKKNKKPGEDVKKAEKKEKVEPTPLKEKPATVRQDRERKIQGSAYRILKTPLVTEKATELVKHNQYVFEVWQRANKNEIKKAVEDVYKIDVVSVRIINVPRKQRRLGKVSGWKKGYKKAIVKIKAGQKIEVLPR
ncbi:MAG: 50S ribosomal protein L23 [Candidatus Wildermuthbacteria bacterium]|nr:50S ribosomal protein L23 [Candidatus Wildermuthbacteria bacterium]